MNVNEYTDSVNGLSNLVDNMSTLKVSNTTTTSSTLYQIRGRKIDLQNTHLSSGSVTLEKIKNSLHSYNTEHVMVRRL